MTPCRTACVSAAATFLLLLSGLGSSSWALGAQTPAATPEAAPKPPSIVGNWSVIFDFHCDGGPGNGAWSIAQDGSYSDNAGNTGTWVQNGKFFRMTYSNRSYYDGKLKKKNVAVGRIFDAAGGDIGCWKASR